MTRFQSPFLNSSLSRMCYMFEEHIPRQAELLPPPLSTFNISFRLTVQIGQVLSAFLIVSLACVDSRLLSFQFFYHLFAMTLEGVRYSLI